MKGVHKDVLGEEPRPAASSSFIFVLAGVLQQSEGEHLHQNTYSWDKPMYLEWGFLSQN